LIRRIGRSVLTIAALLYVSLLVAGAFFSDRLIFHPHAPSYTNAGIIKLASGSDSISVRFLPNPSAKYTILYSHGNAEDLGDILLTLDEIRRAGFNVLAFDYRGYGTSTGKPSERAAYQDEDAAYDYITKVRQTPPDHIIALGRSLGGGVAIDLASRRPLAGLIVQSSFTSAFRVLTGAKLMPFDEFRSIDKIGAIHCPVFVIHGTEDRTIAPWHGAKLFAAFRGPKRSWWVAGAGHDDLPEVAGKEYASRLRAFAASIDSGAVAR